MKGVTMADIPITREEKYLAYLTGDYKADIPKPITRQERYLYELCLKGMGGEISPEEIQKAVNDYLEKNPVKPGATTEQVQQIEQNKTDIASLKEETGLLKEDISTLSYSCLYDSKITDCEVISSAQNGGVKTSNSKITIPSGKTGTNSWVGGRIYLKAIPIIEFTKLVMVLEYECSEYAETRLDFNYLGTAIEFELKLDKQNKQAYFIFDSNGFTGNYFSFVLVAKALYSDVDEFISVNSAKLYSFNTADKIKYDNRLYKKLGKCRVVANALNGSSYTQPTLTIPSGETGNASWIGAKYFLPDYVFGKKIHMDITCRYSKVGNYLSAIQLGTAIKDAIIKDNNGYITVECTIPEDYQSSYIAFAYRVTNTTPLTEDGYITVKDTQIYLIDESIPVNSIQKLLPTYGKKMYCLGDSYTHMEFWQGTVMHRCGLSDYELSAVYGGSLTTNYADCELVYTDSDIVTVFYGTNDWKNNADIGTISDDVSNGNVTFMGALNYVANWLSVNRPNAQVLFITHSQRYNSTDEEYCAKYGISDNGYAKNSKGNTLEDFAKAIIDVANKYGYPVCDLFHNSGINKNNLSVYYEDDKLHPNSRYGGVRIGNLIAQSIISSY